MVRTTFFLIAISIWFSNAISAQSKAMEVIKKYDFVKVEPNENLSSYLINLCDELHVSLSDFDQINQFQDLSGKHHIKFQQKHKGLRILGGIYNIHLIEGNVISSNGLVIPHLNSLNTNPKLSKKDLEHTLNRSIQGSNSNDIHLTIHKSELVISDRIYPKQSGHYTLAYKVSLTIDSPYDKREYIVDAHTGRIIFTQSTLCSFAVNGKCKSRYYGEVNFVVDSIEPDKFLLRDPIRNITTYTIKNGILEQYTDTDNYWDLESDDQDEVAIDAHYCASRFHDFMNHHFGWKGLDGNGLAMNPVIHANQGKPLLNAYWDGDYAFFGNGDCHHSPLTTYSVVGHEFMHGITQNTSDLIYAEEPGAINESMSDIFGKSLEYLQDNSNFSWELGPEFSISSYASYFRNMADPNAFNDPSFYRGEFWDYNGAVHTNSGVFNYWFYLMVEGRNATNEIGINYNVTPNSIMDVLQIVWLTQNAYLTPTSTLPDLFQSSLEATESLFGKEHTIYTNAKEAWKACGLPRMQSDTLHDLTGKILINETSTCYESKPFDLKYQVINQGNKTLGSGDTLNIKITINPYIDTLYEIILQQDFHPGEILDFEEFHLFDIDEDKVYFVNMVVVNEDDITNNNYTAEFFRNFKEQDPLLYVTGMLVEKPECFSNRASIEFFIGNNGCAPLQGGSIFDLQIKEGNTVLHQKQFVIEEDINAGSRVGYNFTIDHLESNGEVWFDLITESIKVKTNPTKVAVQKTKEINGAYLNNFDDLSILNDVTTKNIYGNVLYNYNNNDFLALYGTYHGKNKIPCLDTENNIDLVSHGESNIEVCLDLSNMVNPILNFDLVQFRYDAPHYEEVIPNSTVARIQYHDQSNSFKDLIYNQKEGEVINHTYSFPDQFKGRLKLDFFAHYSENGTTEPLNYDANLIDNFSISGLSNNQSIENKSSLVYPNPTNGVLYIKNLPKGSTIEIININGQSCHVDKVGFDQINISDLIPGIYILKLINQDQEAINHKIIKFD